MSYLILPDFKLMIQTDNLSAILGADFTLLDKAKAAAQTELTSYLIQKYDLSQEFTDTTVWNITTAYKAGQRVYLDAPVYDPTKNYVVNNLTTNTGNVYLCTTGQTGAFNPANWTLLGLQNQIFYVTLPYPLFDPSTIYLKSTQVFWKDKSYTNLIPTSVLSHTGQIQYGTYSNVPPLNIFPDDPNLGLKNWGAGVAYSVNAGTLPTVIAKWTAGDNRNQQMLNGMIDIALYTVHKRIAPRNIPELRVKAYDDIIRWLKNAAKGTDITAALPVKLPPQGGRIRWGSQVQKQTNY